MSGYSNYIIRLFFSDSEGLVRGIFMETILGVLNTFYSFDSARLAALDDYYCCTVSS